MTLFDIEPVRLGHIEIAREPDLEPERRRRRSLGTRVPTPDDPQRHVQELAHETAEALAQASAVRQRHGINPSRLEVLEFSSHTPNVGAILDERFHAWIVEERIIGGEGGRRYRALVQFPSDDVLDSFQAEFQEQIALGERAGVLPPAMRRDFLFDLRHVSLPSREDRIGGRLREEGYPVEETIYIDVDFWHPGDTDAALDLMDDIRGLCRRNDGSLIDQVRTTTLLLAKVRGPRSLAEALLDLEFVARVDLPPVLPESQARVFDFLTPPDIPAPSEDDPLVCVVDSEVVAGHPLLRGWVVEERDFETGEGTVVDRNGHGTAVSGLVVYGDVARCLDRAQWEPMVRVCSAKVLKDASDGSASGHGMAVFPDELRAEGVVEEAIRYFHRERNCRVFNLSLGSRYDVYRGGRQFAWAEKLDELARELDIVIVVATGNEFHPEVPDGVHTREALQAALRDQLLGAEQRVTNPATAALARSEAISHHLQPDPYPLRDAVVGAPAGAPSPFTRTGPGYNHEHGTSAGVKPDLVDYGGNMALRTTAGADPQWTSVHFHLGEPTLHVDPGGLLGQRIVGARAGTSFACPHVSHAAARTWTAAERALGRSPSANLVRALIGSATDDPPCQPGWIIGEDDSLRVFGYGTCKVDDAVSSHRNRVTLVATEELAEDRFHLYRVAVPESFLSGNGRRGIIVALAYDPPVRASRKEYLARTMWVEVLHGLSTDEAAQLRRNRQAGDPMPIEPSGSVLDLRPTRTDLQWSTLQVRRIAWIRRPRLHQAQGETAPVVHVIVGCQRRFPTGLETGQRYGLAVVFWHNDERVELYQQLRASVRVPAARIRLGQR